MAWTGASFSAIRHSPVEEGVDPPLISRSGVLIVTDLVILKPSVTEPIIIEEGWANLIGGQIIIPTAMVRNSIFLIF